MSHTDWEYGLASFTRDSAQVIVASWATLGSQWTGSLGEFRTHILSDELHLPNESLIGLWIHLAVQQTPLEDFLRISLAFWGDANDDMVYALLRIGHALSWGSISHSVRHIVQDNPQLGAMPLALFAMLKHPNQIAEAVALAQQNSPFTITPQTVACVQMQRLGPKNP